MYGYTMVTYSEEEISRNVARRKRTARKLQEVLVFVDITPSISV